MQEPISTPGSTPAQPSKPIEPGGPVTRPLEEGQPKPFSYAPESLEKRPQTPTQADKPTPMDLARDRSATPQWTPEQMSEKLQNLKEQFGSYQNRLQGPEAKNMTPDHLEAFKRLTKKIDPDMKTIAEKTESTYKTPEMKKGGLLEYVVNWLGGAQSTFTGALNFLEESPTLNPADFLKMQYSVQRATQRGELFASIVGSSVSGIKTLMSTQLG